MRPEINLWRTGNKSQRAFGAHALARIPQRNSPISTRRRRTLWLPLNWRVISKPPAKMPKPQNGTPPPRPVFAVRIGRPRHRKRPSGLVGKLRRWNRRLILLQWLLLSRCPSLGFRSNKARQYLKPSQRRHDQTRRRLTSSRWWRRMPPPRQDLPPKAHVAGEADAVGATAAKEASLAKRLPPPRNKMAQDLPPPAHPFPPRPKIPWIREQADPLNRSCLVFRSNRWVTPEASRSAGATVTL